MKKYFKFKFEYGGYFGFYTKIRRVMIENKFTIFSIIGPLFVYLITVGLITRDYESYELDSLLIGTIIIFIIDVILLVIRKLLIIKYQFKSDFKEIYERKIYTDLSPAHIRMVLENGNIDAVSISSTLIDLIDRGILEIRRKDNTKVNNNLNLFDKKNNVIIYKKDMEKVIAKHEKFLIDWFIDELGDKKEVSTDQIRKELMKSYRPAEKFIKWQDIVISTFPVNELIKKNNNLLFLRNIDIFGILLTIIPPAIVYLFIDPISTDQVSLSIPLFYFMNFGIGLCTLFKPPLLLFNQKGVNVIARYKALKNYLLDFGDMKSKEPEAVKIWNQYLVFAVTFDIAKEVKNDIEDFYGHAIYMTDENPNKN